MIFLLRYVKKYCAQYLAAILLDIFNSIDFNAEWFPCIYMAYELSHKTLAIYIRKILIFLSCETGNNKCVAKKYRTAKAQHACNGFGNTRLGTTAAGIAAA